MTRGTARRIFRWYVGTWLWTIALMPLGVALYYLHVGLWPAVFIAFAVGIVIRRGVKQHRR